MEIRHEEERRRLRARFDENLERRNVQFRQPVNNTPPQYDTNDNIYTNQLVGNRINESAQQRYNEENRNANKTNRNRYLSQVNRSRLQEIDNIEQNRSLTTERIYTPLSFLNPSQALPNRQQRYENTNDTNDRSNRSNRRDRSLDSEHRRESHNLSTGTTAESPIMSAHRFIRKE